MTYARTIVVGRGRTCDVVVRNPRVSARHCTISLDRNGCLWVGELDSDEGTCVRTPSGWARIRGGEQFSFIPGYTLRVGDFSIPWRRTAVRNDLIFVRATTALGVRLGMSLLQVLGAHRCAGQICCIHNPSAHYIRLWPQNWRADRRQMERTCPHGHGHPDPDDLNPGHGPRL